MDNDAEYLQKYLDISNKFLNGNIKLGRNDEYDGDLDKEVKVEPAKGTARYLLKQLNLEYQSKITASLLKNDIMGRSMASYENDGWIQSFC